MVVKCLGCRFVGENYLTALNEQGIFRFSYCNRVVWDCRVVDPDIDRECGDFEEKDGETTKTD